MKLEAVILHMSRLLEVGAPKSISVGLFRAINVVLPFFWITRLISLTTAPFLDIMAGLQFAVTQA